jgi:FtsH-binding integral membrane protein
MTQFPNQYSAPHLGYRDTAADRSVFNFFNAVYAWMAVGIALTAVVGYAVSVTPALRGLVFANMGVYVAFALGAFALSWYVQSQIGRLTATTATVLFLVYATLMGAITSYIFIRYSPQVLLSAFLLTGGTFGAMSVYGFVTKRDLSGIGSFLIMAAIGLFIASLVNIFLASGPLSWFITYAVLIVFVGITAYETQMLKAMAVQLAHDPVMAQRYAVVGSLVLYISFINIFLSILRIMGDRR